MMKKQRKGNGQKSKRRQQKISAFVSPFPVRRQIALRYTNFRAMGEAVAGAGDSYAYSPSSLYDPEVAVGGHQPMYYDQLFSATGPYTKYLVTSATFTVRLANTVSLNTANVVVYVSPTSTAPASLTQAYEKPWAKKVLLGPASGGNSTATVILKAESHKALGITKTHLLTDDYYAGVYNANPTINWFVTVAVYGNRVQASIDTVVEIEMHGFAYSLTNTSTS